MKTPTTILIALSMALGACGHNDAQMITERVNTFYKKYQARVPEQDYTSFEHGLRVEYLTDCFQRELAIWDELRQDDSDCSMVMYQEDPYTMTEGVDESPIRVTSVKIQRERADVLTSSGKKIILFKQHGKWLIDWIGSDGKPSHKPPQYEQQHEEK